MEMYLSNGPWTHKRSFAVLCLFPCYEPDIFQQVAVKSLLVYASDEVGEAMEKKIKVGASMKACIYFLMPEVAIFQRIRHEFNICARLEHPNILPVHGFTSGFGPFLAIVSPWAEKGNLTNYLEREDANISVVKRFQLVNMSLYSVLTKGLMVVLAEGYHSWTSIPYVFASILLPAVMNLPR